MAAITSLEDIKKVARGENVIQRLVDSDPLVEMVLDAVDIQVEAAVYGRMTKIAQTYLAAHFLKMAHNSANADGKLASESIGGISQSFTLPYFTTKTVLGATQYGMQFLEYRNMVIPPVMLIQPNL